MKVKKCVRCCLDSTVKHISFDENGVCSFCNAYDKIKDRLHDYNNLERLFLKKIANNGNHKYDAAVGFSGGKDSTYLLYKLVKDYKLKVKAFTLDNGFLSPEAKEKIKEIVNELGVEHEFYECDDRILKEMYHYICKKYLSPCIACSFLGYAVMINYASKIDAACTIHGRSIPQMLRAYQDADYDFYKPFIVDGLSEDSLAPEELYKDALRLIDKLVDERLAKRIKDELLIDGFKNGFRPFVAYYLYHPYNKDEIIKFLEENTSWRVISEEEHFDCLIHHGAMYLKNMIARRSHLMPEIAVMMREGTINSDEAKAKLIVNDDKKIAIKELKEFAKYAGLNYNTLMLKAKIYSKRWW